VRSVRSDTGEWWWLSILTRPLFFLGRSPRHTLSLKLDLSFGKGLPKFIDSHDNLCNLTSNKTRDQVGVRYNVLSFGDSYELEFCRVRPFGLQYHPQSQPHIYGDCSFQNESINYKLHRGYGQQGDPKGTWKWCNESSVSAIAKMGKYFDESTSTPSASFGAVVLVGSLRFAQRLVYR
jgi:hypothetical protein